jgi:hypothetical protein
MKLYRGQRMAVFGEGRVARVWVDEYHRNDVGSVVCRSRLLPACAEGRFPAPAEFEWGYRGAGPAQLAFALLMDVLGDSKEASVLYVDLKEQYVAGWGPHWTIAEETLLAWVDGQRRQQLIDTTVERLLTAPEEDAGDESESQPAHRPEDAQSA